MGLIPPRRADPRGNPPHPEIRGRKGRSRETASIRPTSRRSNFCICWRRVESRRTTRSGSSSSLKSISINCWLFLGFLFLHCDRFSCIRHYKIVKDYFRCFIVKSYKNIMSSSIDMRLSNIGKLIGNDCSLFWPDTFQLKVCRSRNCGCRILRCFINGSCGFNSSKKSRPPR